MSSAVRRLAPARIADPLSLPSWVEIDAGSLQLLMPIKLLATKRARLEDGEAVAPDAAEPGLLRLDRLRH